jgi:glucan phosphoethanolaminetransferase (alkaline phosphatase superfamily)
MEIFIVYWVIVALLFVVGIIQVIIKAVKNQPVKPGLKLVIASIIMLVIGAGACAVILSNLNIGH